MLALRAMSKRRYIVKGMLFENAVKSRAKLEGLIIEESKARESEQFKPSKSDKKSTIISNYPSIKRAEAMVKFGEERNLREAAFL